jgi:hypothetical protein
VPAAAVAALDVAFGCHRQVNAAILVVIATKTGVPLDVFPLITLCRHICLPPGEGPAFTPKKKGAGLPAPLPKRKGPGESFFVGPRCLLCIFCFSLGILRASFGITTPIPLFTGVSAFFPNWQGYLHAQFSMLMTIY